MFTMGSPPFLTTQTTTMWVRKTTVRVIPLQKTMENNFKNPMFTRSPPPFTTQTTTVWLHETTVWVYFSKNYTEPLCESIHLKTQPLEPKIYLKVHLKGKNAYTTFKPPEIRFFASENGQIYLPHFKAITFGKHDVFKTVE